MKKSIVMAMATVLISVNSFALTMHTTHEKLRFDNNIDLSINKVDSKYLVIVQDEIKFPEGAQKEKLFKAINMLGEILNGEVFKKRVIGYLRNSNGEREYSKNYLWSDVDNKLTNEDVYELIMNGDERIIPETIGEMNINVWQYRSSWWTKHVVGYTNPSKSKWISVNSRHYNGYEIHEMVANITHEWMHLLGFLHGKNNTREEVPYVVGRIAGAIAKEILEQQK